MQEQPSSLVEMFVRQCSLNPVNLLYGTLGQGGWFGSVMKINYLTALKMTLAIAEYLNDSGNLLGERIGDVVGIYAANRHECMVAEYAMYILQRRSCVVYARETRENIEHILKETEMETCFISAECASFLIKNELLDSVKLKNVILLDDDFEQAGEFEKRSIRVHRFSDIKERETEFSRKCSVKKALRARKKPAETYADAEEIYNEALDYVKSLGLSLPKEDDELTICYTSGTTGVSKGAVLTHRNFLALIGSFDQNSKLIQPKETDVYFSYLPLAHVFERAVTALLISRSASIWFGSGTREHFVEDIKKIKPTVFAAVPKVLKRISDSVYDGIQRNFFLRYLHSKSPQFVMRMIRRRRLGAERMRVCVCGSAYLDPGLCRDVQNILGCPVLQGYGMTETTAGVFIRPVKEEALDTVGVPLSCVKVKLVDPEREDLDECFGGKEIHVKGDVVFKKYYKNEEATRAVLSEDGWLKTGDIASVDEHGMYRILDRNSNVVKLSNGMFVALEKLEATFNLSGANEILVFESPDRSGIHVVVFSEDEGLKKALEEKAVSLIEANEIQQYEKPKAIFVVTEEMLGEKVESFLTPTGKKKRRTLLKALRERNLVQK